MKEKETEKEKEKERANEGRAEGLRKEKKLENTPAHPSQGIGSWKGALGPPLAMCM